MDVVKFMLSFMTLFLTAMSGAAVLLAASALFRVYAVAHLVSTFIFVVMMVGADSGDYTLIGKSNLAFVSQNIKCFNSSCT